MRASECPQVSGLWGREVRGGCFAFSETLWARKLRGPSIRLSDSYTTTPPVLFFNPEPLKAVVLINVIAFSYSSSASLPPFQKWGGFKENDGGGRGLVCIWEGAWRDGHALGECLPRAPVRRLHGRAPGGPGRFNGAGARLLLRSPPFLSPTLHPIR